MYVCIKKRKLGEKIINEGSLVILKTFSNAEGSFIMHLAFSLLLSFDILTNSYFYLYWDLLSTDANPNMVLFVGSY